MRAKATAGRPGQSGRGAASRPSRTELLGASWHWMPPSSAVVAVLLQLLASSSSVAVPIADEKAAAALGAAIVMRPEDFGAVGDGKANDWVPIQRALAACATVVYSAAPRRSCRVLFANAYLSGPLVVNSSRTTLDVAAGARLQMLPRPDYEKACPQTGCPFLSTVATPDSPGHEGCRTVYPNPHAPGDGYAVCLSDVALQGGGIIDGGATWDPSSWWLCGRLDLSCWRAKMACFYYIEGFTVRGSLTFRNTPTGSLRMSGNVRARVSGLTITDPYSTRNTDGINVYGGYDTLLEDSVIDNGDDCVSFVPAGEFLPGKVSNVTGDFCYNDPGNILCSGGHAVVRNLTCNGGHGLSIGGIRHGTVKNVTFSNITATGGQPGCTQGEAAGGGCRVKSRPNSTGTVRDIRYEDMVFQHVYWPLQLLGHCEAHPAIPAQCPARCSLRRSLTLCDARTARQTAPSRARRRTVGRARCSRTSLSRASAAARASGASSPGPRRPWPSSSAPRTRPARTSRCGRWSSPTERGAPGSSTARTWSTSASTGAPRQTHARLPSLELSRRVGTSRQSFSIFCVCNVCFDARIIFFFAKSGRQVLSATSSACARGPFRVVVSMLLSLCALPTPLRARVVRPAQRPCDATQQLARARDARNTK